MIFLSEFTRLQYEIIEIFVVGNKFRIFFLCRRRDDFPLIVFNTCSDDFYVFFLQHFQSGVDTFTKQNQSIYFDNPHRNCAICQIWMDRQYDEILQLHTMMS